MLLQLIASLLIASATCFNTSCNNDVLSIPKYNAIWEQGSIAVELQANSSERGYTQIGPEIEYNNIRYREYNYKELNSQRSTNVYVQSAIYTSTSVKDNQTTEGLVYLQNCNSVVIAKVETTFTMLTTTNEFIFALPVEDTESSDAYCYNLNITTYISNDTRLEQYLNAQVYGKTVNNTIKSIAESNHLYKDTDVQENNQEYYVTITDTYNPNATYYYVVLYLDTTERPGYNYQNANGRNNQPWIDYDYGTTGDPYYSYTSTYQIEQDTNQNLNYEVVDIGGLMFEVLTMPFSFISVAFNLTVFPGTPYAINFTQLFLTIIGVIIIMFIIRKFR